MDTFTSFAEEGSSSVWQNEGASKNKITNGTHFQKKTKSEVHENMFATVLIQMSLEDNK